MPANNTSWLVHYLAGRHPGCVGLLYTPARVEKPMPHLPYVLDNGAFALAVKDMPFNDVAWQDSLNRYAFHSMPPDWLVVPDVPFDGEATIRQWNEQSSKHKDCGRPLAIAVQDGMTPDTVRSLSLQPDVIFIGGTTEWKWNTLPTWCKEFPRVHVARVNGRKGLDICAENKAESCDGSGWFRGCTSQLSAMVEFIADYWGGDKSQLTYMVKMSRNHAHDQLALLDARDLFPTPSPTTTGETK